MTLSEMIRRAGFTDQALADQVGVSRPYVTRIRTGKRQPSLPVAVKLAEATKLPVSVFIKEVAA